MSPRHLALAAALGLAAPALAGAHDLWIEPTPSGFVLRSGHRGGELVPIDGTKLVSLRCADGRGGSTELRPTATLAAREVTVAGRCAALSARLEGGFYSLTPDGERNLPRDQVPDAVRSWESVELAKWVEPRLAHTLVQGDELELVAARELARVRPGDKITWTVLRAGKPVEGAVLAIDHRPLGETDREGHVRVTVRGAGLQIFDASLRVPLRSPKADALVLSASIAVEIAP